MPKKKIPDGWEEGEPSQFLWLTPNQSSDLHRYVQTSEMDFVFKYTVLSEWRRDLRRDWNGEELVRFALNNHIKLTPEAEDWARDMGLLGSRLPRPAEPAAESGPTSAETKGAPTKKRGRKPKADEHPMGDRILRLRNEGWTFEDIHSEVAGDLTALLRARTTGGLKQRFSDEEIGYHVRRLFDAAKKRAKNFKRTE